MKPISLQKLEIKHLSLAQEARLIRRKEVAARKWKKFESEGYKHLHEHFYDIAEEKPDGGWQLKNGEDINYDGSPKGLRKYVYVENRKYNPDLRHVFREHRLKTVRPEIRAAHLALGFLKKMPYRAMESIAYDPPMWDKVWHNVMNFGSFGNLVDVDKMKEEFLQWADAVLPPSEATSKHNQQNMDYTKSTGDKPPSWFIKYALKWA